MGGRGDVPVDARQIEALPQIVHADLDPVWQQREGDVHRLARVALVPVLDGVGAGFDHRHRDLRAGVFVQGGALAHRLRDTVEQRQQLEAAGDADRDDFGGRRAFGHVGAQPRGVSKNAWSTSRAPAKSAGTGDTNRSLWPDTGWANSSSAACRAWRGSRSSKAPARLRSALLRLNC